MLSNLLSGGHQLIIAGVYDGLSARIASQSGFEVIYMSGFAVAGSLLEMPDIGRVTATEMAERARQIVDVAGNVPVIADGDNGYGNQHNVARLGRAYEMAGLHCSQLDDTANPKR